MADESGMKQNGWNEYSKLVIKELQTLSDGIDNLSTEVADIKKDIVQIRASEDRISKLEKWKDKVDDVATPPQLKEISIQVDELKKLKKEVSDLSSWKVKVDEVSTPTQLKEVSSQVEDYKRFKTQATTIFAVVQFLMAAIMFAMKFIGS
jgi:uncharacterized phage infection (PIP) family protein YhgE